MSKNDNEVLAELQELRRTVDMAIGYIESSLPTVDMNPSDYRRGYVLIAEALAHGNAPSILGNFAVLNLEYHVNPLLP